MLVGFEEIIILNRIQLAQRTQGFRYTPLFSKMEKGIPIDVESLENDINCTLDKEGTIFVGPYLENPPSSYVHLIKENNPNFDEEYNKIVSILNKVDRDKIEWLPLTVTTESFLKILILNS